MDSTHELNDVHVSLGQRPSKNADSAESPLLDMASMTKDFPAGRVLHGVDFAVQSGEVHALVGQNGAGKSTLMKILAGLYPDHGGTITLDGERVEMRSPRAALAQGIAVVYQEFALAPDLTVAENIALGRESRGVVPGAISHRAISRRSAAEAKSLGIELDMDARVGDLGVADQQLTEIVKAASRNARILVMDEPTARLSPIERDRLFEIIGRLSARGVGVVYISHYLEEIFSVATKVTVLRDGRVVTCDELANLSLNKLATLMVGDKFREIELETRQHLAERADGGEPALTLVDFEIEGLVAPVSLTIRKGEVVGLAGLQGSGRTDLAEAITGAQRKGRKGQIITRTFKGLPRHPYHALEAGILMLPANRKTQGILGTRPLSENIAVGALRKRVVRAGVILSGVRRALVLEMLTRFGVRPPDPGLRMDALSGGNQQKVLFARAAAAQADVLILDQPTAGVDVGATFELYEQVDALTDAGLAVLLISDDLTELLRLSDTIILMKSGQAGVPRPAREYDRASLLEAITGNSPDVATGWMKRVKA